MLAGDLYDFDLGPDDLTRVPQWVRVQVVETVTDATAREWIRLRAVGGGPTNIPRWAHWPTLVYARGAVDSLVRGGHLVAVPPQHP